MVVDYAYVIDQLKLRRGQWSQIERDRPDFTQSWISKLVRGQIEDPGFMRLHAMEQYLRLLARLDAERQQTLALEVAGG